MQLKLQLSHQYYNTIDSFKKISLKKKENITTTNIIIVIILYKIQDRQKKNSLYIEEVLIIGTIIP